jgi:hypothetical protein
METPTLRLLPRSLALVAALLALPLAAAAQPALDRPITFPAPDGRTPLNSLPVRLTVRLSGGAQPPTVRAWLNGRDVTRLFARAGAGACLVTACDLVAEVTPGDGLQPGLNELRVEARTGVPGVVANSLSFVLQMPLPAADAGADQKGAPGQAMRSPPCPPAGRSPSSDIKG